MARVTWTLGELRGKVGGVVAQRNASGTIVRVLTRPRRGRSVMQSLNRGLWSSITREWTSLTVTERAAWQTAASSPTSWRPMDPYPGTAYTGAMCHDACRRQQYGQVWGTRYVSAAAIEGVMLDNEPAPIVGQPPPTVRTDNRLLTSIGPLVHELDNVFLLPGDLLVLRMRFPEVMPGTPVEIPAGQLIDGTEQEPPQYIGFKVYLSQFSPVPVRAAHYRRRYLLAAVGAWPVMTTSVITMSGGYNLQLWLELSKLESWARPIVGWWYQCEVWQVSIRGTAEQLGAPVLFRWQVWA